MYRLRTIATALALCVWLPGVVSNHVAGETYEEHLKLVESKLAVLGDSDERKDFDAARATVFQAFREFQPDKKFEYAGLLVKLLHAVDSRIDALAAIEGDDGVGGDDLLGTGLLSPEGAPSFDSLSIGNLKPADSKNELNEKQRSLQRYLPKFSMTASRTLFSIFRQAFSGKEDLEKLVDTAIDDEEQRDAMTQRLSNEFKALDKKYMIISGKLVPRPGR